MDFKLRILLDAIKTAVEALHSGEDDHNLHDSEHYAIGILENALEVVEGAQGGEL